MKLRDGDDGIEGSYCCSENGIVVSTLGPHSIRKKIITRYSPESLRLARLGHGDEPDPTEVIV